MIKNKKEVITLNMIAKLYTMLMLMLKKTYLGLQTLDEQKLIKEGIYFKFSTVS